MGKFKKKSEIRLRSVPLHEQIGQESSVKATNREKIRVRAKEGDSQVVDEKLSGRILAEARKQQYQLENEQMGDERATAPARAPRVQLGTVDGDSSDQEDEEEADNTGEERYEENIEVNEDEARELERFMSTNPAPRRVLADIIMEKLTEKQTEIASQLSDNTGVNVQELDPRVQSMYESVRTILSKYRSGKLPKSFKVVPKLRNWEQILYITDPEQWSAAAMYQATRIFTSNLQEKMAQRFFNLVLLPRVRDDISYYKQLNFHLYQALKKALFKPGAFMKGVLLPLCESGNCTLREAIIVGSVISKLSIPVLHSSAAILKIAEMEYNGANSIFLRILFDKKYALPYRVIDASVFHFLRFEMDRRQMPVLWHQALLTFVQRYKEDVSNEQKEALLQLLKKQSHPVITPEVRRELLHAKCRDELMES